MKLDLKNHKIFIGGIQGSGKTTLAKYLISKFKRAVCIRITPDYDDVDNIVLVKPSGSYQDDLEDLATMLVKQGKAFEEKKIKEMPYDLLVIDEADLAFRGNHDLGPSMLDLVAMHRHYGLGIIFITRRIQDIPARITESTKHRFFFAIEGKNALTYIENMDERLAVLMTKIEADKHNFIYKELGKPPILHKAIKVKEK